MDEDNFIWLFIGMTSKALTKGESFILFHGFQEFRALEDVKAGEGIEIANVYQEGKGIVRRARTDSPPSKPQSEEVNYQEIW